MSTIGLVGLVKIELPSQDILLCDGGFFTYLSDTYRSADPTFGTIQSVEAIEEGVGDTVPAIIMNLLPPTTTAVADLSAPGNQTSTVTFYIAEYDVEDYTIITGEAVFTGQVDQTVFTLGRQGRKLTMSVVSLAERLFEGNIGNSLDPTFHKYVWPGETGHDHATGLKVPIAWGTESASSSPTGASSGSGGGSKKDKKNRAYSAV